MTLLRLESQGKTFNRKLLRKKLRLKGRRRNLKDLDLLGVFSKNLFKVKMRKIRMLMPKMKNIRKSSKETFKSIKPNKRDLRVRSINLAPIERKVMMSSTR